MSMFFNVLPNSIFFVCEKLEKRENHAVQEFYEIIK